MWDSRNLLEINQLLGVLRLWRHEFGRSRVEHKERKKEARRAWLRRICATQIGSNDYVQIELRCMREREREGDFEDRLIPLWKAHHERPFYFRGFDETHFHCSGYQINLT